MPLYTQSIKNLKGGMSQQPDILRFQDQGAKQVNAWSSESEGLQKRPPTVWKRRIAEVDSIPDNSKFHLINRDEQEQYYVVFTGGGVRVFDLEGKELVVTGPMSYVKSTTPQVDFRVITVADYTFIVNRTVASLRSVLMVDQRSNISFLQVTTPRMTRLRSTRRPSVQL